MFLCVDKTSSIFSLFLLASERNMLIYHDCNGGFVLGNGGDWYSSKCTIEGNQYVLKTENARCVFNFHI